MNWQDMTAGQKSAMIRRNRRMERKAERERKNGKPNRQHLIEYMTKYTGGSLRHGGIRMTDIFQALLDLNRDWQHYHDNDLAQTVKEMRLKKEPQK